VSVVKLEEKYKLQNDNNENQNNDKNNKLLKYLSELRIDINKRREFFKNLSRNMDLFDLNDESQLEDLYFLINRHLYHTSKDNHQGVSPFYEDFFKYFDGFGMKLYEKNPERMRKLIEENMKEKKLLIDLRLDYPLITISMSQYLIKNKKNKKRFDMPNDAFMDIFGPIFEGQIKIKDDPYANHSSDYLQSLPLIFKQLDNNASSGQEEQTKKYKKELLKILAGTTAIQKIK
jgi:hypothetical protein